MSIFVDTITNLGIEAVKEKIPDAISAAKVKARLEDYINRQHRLNFDVSLEEEIDFGGVAEYIQTDLVEDVKQRFFGNKTERGLAHKSIMEKAVTYASANTKLSAKRTMKLVGTAVNILADYYRSRANKDLLFLTGEIEDTIVTEHEKTRELISTTSKHLETVIHDSSAMSIDRAIQEIDDGKLPHVEAQLGTYLNAISAKHSLFPDYGFRMTTDNKIVSIPLTEAARTKYPQNFKITASAVKLGDKPITNMNRAVLDQAYRHQLPIYIDVQNAKKYLGNVLDPAQSEASEMIGARAIVTPPAFPPAFPCSISVGEDIIVPYLLLRTKEILDDGSVILTNEEQENYKFKVSICLTPSTRKLTFTITPNEPTNRDSLNYRLFLKRIMSGETITVFASKQNEQIIRGTVDKKEIDNLDGEISLLQKIIMLEEYFHTTIDIPEFITVGDDMLISRLCDLINGGYHGEADKFDFSFDITKEVRQRIVELTDTDYNIAYSAEGTFTLFGKEFTIPIIREIECVRIENLPSLMKKIEVLDIGDQIKIKYIPAKNRNKCLYTDWIKTEDIEKGLLFSRKA